MVKYQNSFSEPDVENGLVKPKLSLPRHIAFIMDGNRRWAEKRGLNTFRGHVAGMQSLEVLLKTCKRIGIKVISIYAFSSENWHRPDEEKKKLFELIDTYIREKAHSLIKEGTRLRILGDLERFNPQLRNRMLACEKESQHNSDYTLQIALGYGGRDEIVRAANTILERRLHSNSPMQNKIPITTQEFSNALDTVNECFPDLLIRTGGEQRLSNFLLYQIAYTELYFCETLWPDFGETQLLEAIADYSRRERRYGRRSPVSSIKKEG